jgi:riboflavin kinase/FMN adenylyltransferase
MAKAVLIGIFDGVHQGHQELIRIAQSRGEVTALTFYPHPTSIIAPERTPRELIPLEDRIALLKKHGASHVEVVEFTQEFAGM